MTAAAYRALLTVGFAAALLTMLATQAIYRETAGRFLDQLARVKLPGSIPLVGGVGLGFAGRFNAYTKARIAQALEWGERGFVAQLNALIDTAGIVFGLFVLLGIGLVELSKLVTHALGVAAGKGAHALTKVSITHAVGEVWGRTWRQVRRINRRLAALAGLIAALAHRGADAVRLPFGRIGALERKVLGLGKRLTAVEKAALGATAIGLTWAALRRMGLGFLRCRNVKRAGRGICGIDFGVLEWLIASVAILAGAVSLRQFAHELAEPTDLVMDGIGLLVKEAHVPDPKPVVGL